MIAICISIFFLRRWLVYKMYRVYYNQRLLFCWGCSISSFHQRLQHHWRKALLDTAFIHNIARWQNVLCKSVFNFFIHQLFDLLSCMLFQLKFDLFFQIVFSVFEINDYIRQVEIVIMLLEPSIYHFFQIH